MFDETINSPRAAKGQQSWFVKTSVADKKAERRRDRKTLRQRSISGPINLHKRFYLNLKYI